MRITLVPLTTWRMTFRSDMLTYRILSALERGPRSIADLTVLVHASHDAVASGLKRLLAQRLVHLAGYRRSVRGPFTREWGLGRGEGVFPVKPVPYSTADKCARWRESGGDDKKCYRLKRDAKRISRNMTMAGMLGVT